MESIDLTILFLSNSKLPDSWVQYHKEQLLKSAGKYPIIAITRKPVDWTTNILQIEPESKSNIFWSMLKGANMAETKYIAVAEDDTLYPPSHFDWRPKRDDDFGYNKNRWALYTWSPIYSLKNYIRTNAVLICNREKLIEALEERFKKYPQGTEETIKNPNMSAEIGQVSAELALGVLYRRAVDFGSEEPVIQLDHDHFTIFDENKESVERRHKKKLGLIKAYDIPYWRKAENIINKFI